MRWLALSLLFALAACDNPFSGGPQVEGTYQLTRVDGEPLPYEFLFGVTIESGTLTLSDGTYTTRTTSSFEDWGTGEIIRETDTESGTYTATGGRVQITTPEGDRYSGTLDGDVLLFDFVLIEMEYRRK